MSSAAAALFLAAVVIVSWGVIALVVVGLEKVHVHRLSSASDGIHATADRPGKSTRAAAVRH